MAPGRLVRGCVALCLACAVHASTDKRRVTAAVQGKKLSLEVSTLEELTEEISKQQGLRPDRQVIFYKGKRLSQDQTLAEAGVQDGDQVTVTQARARPAAPASRVAGAPAAEGLPDAEDAVDRGLDAMGGLPSDVDAAAGGLDAGGGSASAVDQLFGGAQQKEVLEALSDPKKLEESRQALLQHPMFSQMAARVPGLAEAAQSPKKWRETMEQAKGWMDQVQSGGPQAAELKRAMEAGMKYFQPDGGAPPPGMVAAPPDGPAATTPGVDAAKLSAAAGHAFAALAQQLGLSLSEAARGIAAHGMGAKFPMAADAYAEQMAAVVQKAGLRSGADLTVAPADGP